jgi:aminopeptidase N
VLKTTAGALALFDELFAPYVHSDLVVVEADFPDGMEYDGFYFLGSEYYAAYGGSPKGYLTAIAAHETAHMWWYGLAGNDQALEPWLDEALATFSELLFYERLYPDLVDWWWDFRVQRFYPRGWVNSTIYQHRGFRSYVDAVYLRGALFMRDLRELVGDEVLFAFLRDYAARNAGRLATREGFFSILAEHTPSDPGPVIELYFDTLE